MSVPACERLALAEASFDGRLGPSEQSSMDRHVRTCAECEAQLRELAQLREALRAGGAAITPLEHQRARLALLRRAAAPAPRKGRSAAAVAAVLVMVPLAVWAAAAGITTVRGHAPDEAADQAHEVRPREEKSPRVVQVGPTAPTPTAATPVEAPQTPVEPPPVETAPAPVTHAAPVVPVPARVSVRAPAAALASAAPAEPEATRASREFAEAMTAVSRGDFGAGAQQLHAFAAAHPADPRTEEAIYLEAIALERAGRSREARDVARRYLAAYPGGVHRSPAQRIAQE
ncbi:MAG: Fe-S oxidoreductase [Labilithrix sp.]|nr:Fe-S oxidoreductase [Labilithrix sp.]